MFHEHFMFYRYIYILFTTRRFFTLLMGGTPSIVKGFFLGLQSGVTSGDAQETIKDSRI